jgi:hypothetical protein
MSKKKNTLKDLDAFLKQEAKSFVQPNKVEPKSVEEPLAEVKTPQVSVSKELSNDDIVNYLSKLSGSDDFYNIIKSSLEKSDINSSESKMLLNTLVYLKDKDHWKENIKSYWS